MRTPVTAVVGGTLVALVGAAGLVQAARSAGGAAAASDATTSDAAAIVVTNAYLRPTLPPTRTTAVYFTVRNTTAQADVLESVVTGAGSSAVLHVEAAGGAMQMVSTLRVPAHGSVTLAPGGGHVMIEGVYGRLTAGQTVNVDLQFANAGDVEVTAPVVPYGQTPGGSSSGGST